MSILDRYIMKEILAPFLLALFGMTFFMTSFTFIQSLEFLFRYQASLAQIGRIYLYSLPFVMVMTVPMSVLMAILLAFGRLSGDSEVIAMKANGVSTFRMFLPALLFAVPAWLASQYMYLVLMPQAEFAVRTEFTNLVQGEANLILKPRVFSEFGDDVVLYVNDLSSDATTASGVFLYMGEMGRSDAKVVVADALTKVQNEAGETQFRLQRGTSHTTALDDPEQYTLDFFQSLDLELQEGAAGKLQKSTHPAMMSMDELHAMREEHRDKGRLKEVDRYTVQIQRRFSIPFACLIFPLFGVAMGIVNVRGGKGSGFAMSIGIFVLYYMLMMLFEGMGEKGQFPPILAVWLPNTLLLAAGGYLMWKATQEKTVWLFEASGRLVETLKEAALSLLQRLQRSKPAQEQDANGPTTSGSQERSGWAARFGFPSLMDQYVGSAFFRAFFLILGLCFAMSFLVHLTERIDKAIESGATLEQILSYFFLKNLFFMFIAIHFAMLVAVMITLGGLSKHSEIIALRAGGISTFRIVLPLLVSGLLLTGFSFWYNEQVVPYSRSRADDIWRHEILGKQRRSSFMSSHKWYRGPSNSVFKFLHFSAGEGRMLMVSWFAFDEQFRLLRRLEADSCEWDRASGQWVTGNSREILFNPDGSLRQDQRTKGLPLDLGGTPDDYAKEVKRAEEMNFQELARTIQLLENAGHPATELWVDLYAKTSQAFIGLVMVLLAIPFGIVPPRQGGFMRGFGVATLIALGFYITGNVFINLGYSGILTPLVAAWSPNVLFSLAGVVMLGRMRG